jgi:N-methylhydantoinase B/oxoprolinase/acetone carboxylase alpha subunit
VTTQASATAGTVSGGAPLAGIDPIRLEVIRSALVAATEEMAATLRRTAYSACIKTRADFSCSFFDRELRVVAQAFTQPVHPGSFVELVPRAMRAYGVDRQVDAGFYEFVRLNAPRGMVVNALPPAPVVGGWETHVRVTDLIFKALAPMLTEAVPAGTKAMQCHTGFGGIDSGTGSTSASRRR